MLRFYGHFAAAYGTFWFVMMLLAMVSGSHINAGAIGFFGFPAIALVYAAIRSRADAAETARLKARIRALETALAFGDAPRGTDAGRADA